MMRQSASLTAGSRDASSTGDRRAAHTPGPWHAHYPSWVPWEGSIAISDDTGANLCWTTTKSNEKNNARLIAAAPDMLAALQEIADDAYGINPREIARAAIALFDHQNVPTDDTAGQRSGLSP